MLPLNRRRALFAACGLASLLVVSLMAGSLVTVSPQGVSSLFTLQLTGSGFSSVASDNTVTFIPASGSPATATASAVATVDLTRDLRRLSVRVPAGLPVGPTALSVTNKATGGTSEGLTIQIISIALADIASAATGATGVAVRITGSPNAQFVSGNTRVSFGQGITVTSTVVESPTSVLATISVAASATVGMRTVVVQSSTHSAAALNAFTVTAPQPTNSNPTANANGPYSGVAGTAITVSGSGSDPDAGDVLSYAWAFGDGGTATGASASHTYAAAGPYTATLTVTDGRGGSASATAGVTIAAANSNPTANAGGPYEGVAGTAITLSGSGSDPDAGDVLSYAWAFGDGGTANGASASHAYAAAGPYTATLTVTDGRGGSATSSVGVTVAALNRPPQADPGGPYAGGVNAGIVFNATSSKDPDGDPLSFAWSFGDGNAASGPAPVHAFAQAGQQTVTLLVSDGRGGTSSASVLVNVSAAAEAPGNHAPTASAGGPYSAVAQTAVTLHGEGSGDADNDALTYAWSFGDGTTGTGATPVHTYAAPGRFTATLLVTDGRGGADTGEAAVVISAAPEPANNAPTAGAGGPYAGATGTPILFSATASDPDSGDTLSYAWSFGDGASGEGATPTHQYLNAGAYDVSVLVTDGRGGAVVAASTAAITAVAGNQPPTAQPGGPYLGIAGEPVTFVFSGSDPDQDPLTFSAEFGDGAQGAGRSPAHAFAQAGTYIITLVVADGRGGVASVTTAAVVSTDTANGNRPPTARAGGPYVVPLGQPIALDGSASTDPDAADALTFAWTLGDGANAIGAQPSHLFAAEGTYPVVLLVSDGKGGTSTASTSVVVTPAAVAQNQSPVASAGGPYSTTLGGAMSFSSTGSGDPDNDTLSYVWNFGDGVSGTGAAPAHTYAAAGDYTVSLLVTDGRGGSATASAAAHVLPPAAANHPPVANAGGPYAGVPAAGIPVSGAGSSDADGDALTFAWNFGDGSPQESGAGPTHAYANAGAYTITLTVTDARGATSTATASAVVGTVADRGPPVVTLNAPSEALPGSHIVVAAQATDDVAVSSVRFEVSGAEPSTAQTAPYQRTIDVPAVVAPGASIQVRAIATDSSSKSAQADATIRITFVADTESPAVALRAPAAAAPGSTVLLSATASDNVGVAQVAFLLNGEPLSTDTEAPYEASFAVPAGAAAGSLLPVVARARDFAGNQTDAGAAVTVSASSDTTPPTVTLAASPQVPRGGTLALTATADDEGGVYGVSFFVDGVRVAVDTTAPYSANYKLPLSIAGGTALQLRAVARDFAGNEAAAAAGSAVENASGAGRGVLSGEVYDDRTGLPLSNVTITLTGNDDDTQPYSAAGITDGRGRYVVRAERGAGVLHIAKAGYTTVDRRVSIVANRAQEVIDARLTSLQPVVTISPVLGGSAGSPAALLQVPSGAIDGELQVSVTPIGQQGLQGLLPVGWIPLAAADIRPHGVAFPAPVPLSMKSGFTLPSGSSLVLASWDEETSAWRAVAVTTAGGAAPQIDASIATTGQFAWLLADRAPSAPPVPAAGDELIGTTGALMPPQTTPRIDPQPKIAFYNPGISSAVHAYVDTAAALPSGSVLWIDVSETYRFYSGAEVHPEPFVQDLVFYQTPDAPLSQAAAFPATPSQVFDALTLERGVISLELLVPPANPAAPSLAGPDGATISAGDAALTIPAGALGDFTPIDLRPLQASDLGIALPSGLEFLGGAQIGFGGTLGAAAALSLPAPAGAADAVLLVRLQDIQGQTRLVLSGIGSVAGGRLVSATSVGGSGQLDGVREAGRYIFFRASAPVGFAAGQVLGVGGAPFPAALVTAAGLPVVSLSGPSGAYVAAAPAGSATLTALDIAKSDTGAAMTTIAASQVSPLDLRLVAQAPRVVAIVPAAAEQNVSLGAPVVVTFSEAVDPASVGSGGDLAVTPAGGSALTGTFSLSNGNTVLTFRPGAPLEPNTRYTVTVGTSIRDLAGYAVEASVSSVFDSLDTAPPPQPAAGAVTASLPAGGNTTVRGTQGTASPHDTVTIVNVTTGAITPVLLDANGGFTTLVVAAATDLLKVRIVDQAGNEVTVGIPRFTQTNADGSVSTAIGNEGGRITGPGGIAADVAQGTFPDGAVVTLNAVAAADFPVAIPADQQQNFGFNGAFSIDFGGAIPTRYVNVSIPALGGETATDQWLVTQVVDVNGTPGLNVVDTAKFINGRIATSSPPCPGVTAAGVYGIHKSFQSVGLNYGQMQNTGYGALVAQFNSPIYGFLPFLTLVPDIQIPTPVCYPVLTGRVTVVPNSVRVTLDGPQLTPADREIIVRNTTRASENRFPRNVVELSLEMPGKDSDSYQVKAIASTGEVVLTGVTVTPGQTGFVTIRPDPDRIAVPVQSFRIRNITSGVVRDYPQALPPLPLTAAGGPSDSFQVFIVDVNGVQRSATFVLDASQYGPGNLLARALSGTIDPTQAEMDAAGVTGPARTRVLLTSSGGLSEEIPAAKIVNGAFAYSFNGNPTDTFYVAVEYDTRPTERIQIPNFTVTVTNPRTGRVIRTLTLQAPPRDEPQSIGVVSDDVTAPFVVAGPAQLTNFDPAGAISFTFSEGMDAQSVKDGLIVRDAAGNRVLGEVRISSGNRVATFVPFAALKLGTDYRLTLVGNDALGTLLEPGMGAGIKDASGNALATMRLTITTFRPRKVSTLASVFGVKDFALRRRRVPIAPNSTVTTLSTYLMAAVESSSLSPDKFAALDMTDPEAPVKLSGDPSYAPTRRRLALAPEVSFQQHDGQTFTGDLAVTTTSNNYYTFLTFYDVTNPAAVHSIGGKLLTANPDTLANFSRLGTYHVLGFGRGVTTLRTATGVNAYAAVEQVGVMVSDVGQNIPERGFDTRIKEALYPGDFTDVAAFNDRLIALEKSGHQLVVLDPALTPLLTFDLPSAPRRLQIVEGYQSDDNHDGLIQPNEIRDLAVIGTDRDILIVDISDLQNVQILGSIPMPAIVRELDIDPVRQRAFAGTSTQIFMIDLSRPSQQGLVDTDGDGTDDRIIWQTTTQYANGLGGLRLDRDRGLLYVGGPAGTDTWAVYDNCCDLGVEMTAARKQRLTGNRGELLQKEKDALKQGISKGLTDAAPICSVTTGSMSILEQGSGACLWTDSPGLSCSANYQPGVSDHDFEVFFPAAVAASAQKCVIDKLQEQFTDPLTKEPRPITVNGSKVEFEDITFFPVSKDAFESAKLGVLPPSSSGSDAVGDAGLGRQQLLLKWLLEGQYVTVPQLAPNPAPLESILTKLTTATKIPALEGYEWSILQGFNLAKSKARVRIKGASRPDSAFRDLFVKQVHDAGKSGIRTALARMSADDAARAQVLDITRLRFEQSACLEILPEVQDPNRWREGPCDSFEDYVASAAARTLRGIAPLGLFTRAEVLDVNRFYRVKADLEVLPTDADADKFVARVARFISDAQTSTLPAFTGGIGADPDAAQRQQNIAAAVLKTSDALANAKIAITPLLFNRGFRNAVDIAFDMWHAPAGAQAATRTKETRQTLAGGDNLYLKYEHDSQGALVLDADQKAKPLFVVGPIDQQASPGVAGSVAFVADLPEKKMREANRQNNLGGFFYYTLDTANPSVPATPAQPPLPPGSGPLDPDAECNTSPALKVSQRINAGGQSLEGEALLGFGETVEIVITVDNLSGDAQNDVTVCSSITNLCYNLGTIAAGATVTKTISFTVPLTGFVADATATAYSSTTGIITAAPLRVIASQPLYTVVPFATDPNPDTSEVMVGGRALRYYRVVRTRDHSPVPNLPVTVEVTGGGGLYPFTFSTNAKGLIVAPNEEGMAVGFDNPLLANIDFTAKITTIDGQSSPSLDGTWGQFPLKIKPREYELSYTRGSAISGSIGALFASVEGSAEAGTTIKRKEEFGYPVKPTELTIASQVQLGLKTGVEFSLFGFKADVGVGKVALEATAGADQSSSWSKGAEYGFTYPLSQDAQCAIAKLTLTNLFNVNPLFTALLDLMVTNPCGDPAPYLRSLSSEYLQTAADNVKIGLKATRPVGSSDKAIGATFGAGAGSSFAIGIQNSRSFTIAAAGGAATHTASKEGYSLKGQIDFNIGLTLAKAEVPSGDTEDEEKVDISVTKFKSAMSAGGSSTTADTHTVTFETDLVKNPAGDKPTSIEIAYEGKKGWGWKRDSFGLEQNLGGGSSSGITYKFDVPADIDKAVTRLATVKVIQDSNVQANLAIQELPFVPTALNEELGKFHGLLFETRPTYEISGSKGDGFSIPFGITGKIAGFKLGFGAEIKSDSKVAFAKERGVSAAGRLFALEKYKADQFIPGATFNLWDAVEVAWDAVLTGYLPQFSDQSVAGNSDPSALLQSSNTARMHINTTLEPPDFKAGLFSYKFRRIQGPVRSLRHMPGDTAGPEGQPHYGVGGFHQFTPEGYRLAQPTPLVIDYRDEDIAGLDESTFAVYAWNAQTKDWDYIGGVRDAAANTVTITTDTFRLYTLAPEMPARAIGVTATDAGVTGAQDEAVQHFTVTTGPLVTNAGAAVADGTIYTVQALAAVSTSDAPYGTITTADADPLQDGIQVAAVNGTVQFAVEYAAPNGFYVPGRLALYSVLGTAYGETIAEKVKP